jgi:hypothetical protein
VLAKQSHEEDLEDENPLEDLENAHWCVSGENLEEGGRGEKLLVENLEE